MATSREHFALDWIKTDILETLNQARQSLEAYAEALEGDVGPDSGTREPAQVSLQSCLNGLHQVHGTLVMLDLSGVTLLAEHLERVASALYDGRLSDLSGPSQSLMQGILELPGYLDELQAGLPDSTSPILPLVNELRGHLGEPPLRDETEVASLSGMASDAALERFDAIDGMDKARRIRAVYQQVLLSLLKGEPLIRALDTLRKVAQGLRRVCEGTPFEAQWQAFGEFVASLDGASDSAADDSRAQVLDSDLVKLLRRVDSEIRDLAQNGAESLQKPVPIALVRSLLDAAEARGYSSPALAELREAASRYKQADALSISARQALVSAAAALREELALVKDRLDLFTRAESGDAGDLESLIEPLQRIASTLSMLGFESSRTMVADQIGRLNAMIGSGTSELADILAAAGALVRVDENLASFSQSGKGEAEKITDTAHKAVALETRQGLESVKQSIVDFVSAQWDVRHLEEVPARLDSLCGALRLIPLRRAADLLGASNRYVVDSLQQGHVPGWEELDLLADAISGIDYYLERLAGDHPVGAEDVLDLVERSLAALEAAAAGAPSELEAASGEDARSPDDGAAADQPLSEPPAEVAEETAYGSAEQVDISAIAMNEPEPELELEQDESFDLSNPLFDELAVAPAEDDAGRPADARPTSTPQTAEPEASAETPDELTLEPAIEASLEEPVAEASAGEAMPEEVEAAPETTPVAASAQVSALTASLADSFESDAEIVEIFVEEVDEVLEAIDEQLPHWQSDLQNEDALTEIRRGFHTLKGSGRMVGANVLGELAWSVENMLNRVMDGTVAPTADFLAVIRGARGLVPVLRDAYESRTAPDMFPVGHLMEQADVLASGGDLAEAAPGTADDLETVGDAAPEPVHGEPPSAAAEAPEALFVEEAEQHLRQLAAAADESTYLLGEDSMRALHTLSGSAAMAGIQTIAEVAGPAYELAQAVREPGRETRVEGDLAAFFKETGSTLAGMVRDLRAGQEPEEQFQLVAEADRLLMGVPADSHGPDPLLGLEALDVVMNVPEFLQTWHEGAMDMAFAEQLQDALAQIQKVAAEAGHEPVAGLAAALRDAHDRLEFSALDQRARDLFGRGHEELLKYVDTIAADQVIRPLPELLASIEGLEADEAEAEAPAGLEAMLEDEALEAADFSLDDLSEDISPAEAEQPAEASEAEVPVLEKVEPREPADSAALAAELEPEAAASVVEGTQPPLIDGDVDQEIIEIFFEEAEEIFENLDQGIHEWSSEPENLLNLENLLRALHTLKGGARLAGMPLLGERTHDCESFLINFQESNAAADAGLFEALHGWYDELTGVVARTRALLAAEAPPAKPADGRAVPRGPEEQSIPAAARAPETGDDLVAESDAAAGSEAADEIPVRPMAAEAAETPAEEARKETPEKIALFPRGLTGAEPAKPAAETSADAPAEAAGGERPDARAPQEMVRVGASLLEDLVNLAGESSIVRARIEQGMSDFTSSLDEMETTIERLREQLRRLEIETETQVLFRQDRVEGPSYEDFDPLEMDRYSQLQQLSRALSESASDMLDLKDTLLFKAREAETLLLQQARLNTELQEGLMRSRMVPFSRLLPRLRRTVRQVSRELDKEVELHAFNVDGELDRNLLERMVPPLEHMLRNAVDHGIETPAERQAQGKAAAGRVDLRLAREGGDVVIEISDDGAGIDVETVRAKALERGLMAADADLGDDEISQFVLAPGFSTAKSVTQISGRGVGMDVVHSEVKQLGGTINISSRPGKGTRFVLRVPFTVSVNRALMVSVGEDLYAIPLNTIEGIVLVTPEQLDKLYAPDGSTFEYAGVPYQVRYLGNFLGREYHAQARQASVPVVLVRSGERAVAVHVDGVQGSREIVVKSLGPQFAGVGGISGATILGDGSVVVILDLLALIRSQAVDGLAVTQRPAAGASVTRTVMVVDDSVTVRKVTSRLLERQGMDVMVAKDGVEAVSLLQERRPDVMLLDIEMPRMDGFEVARQVRRDERLADLPIIMISSRTGEKHQERALELGVNRFLGKPFQENELLACIDELAS